MRTATKRTNGAQKKVSLVIPALNMKDIRVRVIGTTPLLVNNMSNKKMADIEDIQAQLPKNAKRPKRDPESEYVASMYRGPKKEHLFPAVAFRKAMIRSCKLIEGIDMTDARIMFKMPQEFVKIEGGEPVMDRRPVRLKNGSTDLRYRARYDEWSCELVIRYNANWTDAEQMLNLLLLAGETVGIGEMRPEKGGGSFGCFTITPSKR